jgi:hypothetical protein
MRALALLVGLVVVLIGLTGVVAPDSLMAVGRRAITPAGLYGIAALRIGIGLLLFLVAPISRTPKTLRVTGAVVLVAGLTTPLVGVDRVRAIFDWEVAHGTAPVRIAAVLVSAIGAFIAFAVAGGRERPATR